MLISYSSKIRFLNTYLSIPKNILLCNKELKMHDVVAKNRKNFYLKLDNDELIILFLEKGFQ